jgi:phage nucleotide-binding protein
MAIKKSSSLKTPIPFVPVEQLPSVLAVLAYGRSGTGKTTFAATFPGPLLLLDIREKGTDSVSNVKGVKVGEVTTWEQFESIYWYLQKGDHEFKTVVIDQISQLQDLAITKAMVDNGKKPEDQIAKRDWGQAAGLMKTWLLNYRDLIDQGIHVVFLAHDRITGGEGEEGSGEDQIDPNVGPRVMPSVASFLNGAVKVIGNTFIRETFAIVNKRKKRSVEYSMRIGPHAYFTTKTRSPVGIESPDVIVNPSYEKLMAVLTGTYQDDSEPPVVSSVRKKK